MSNRACLEHVAIHVKDMDWHIRFFNEVFGMPVTLSFDESGETRQVWLLGGLQLIANTDFDETHIGPLAHIAIQCEAPSLVVTSAHSWGISSLPDRCDWLQLPQGLVIECVQTEPAAIDAMLALDPRAGALL